MASSHFDKLTRVLASSTSRRQTIKGLIASAGSILAFGSLDTALAAGCIHSGQPYPKSLCKHDKDCCSHNCVYLSVGGDFFCVG